ncbi:hypothetical protein C2869_17200 [Saccharobesus litoralis]|uniref:Porin domain-containing protein n=1 Tax=Saccharobesus litoralis TaxID=2172099 RepID=A0A2S0VV57_9ALTE|nr:porin [Saccharobesus litoralis]AWB68052.1 hypothetical protein C2869_17200 [Saccharobesus litoralis]
MKRKLVSLSVLAVAVSASLPASAELQFRGFASIVGGTSSEDSWEYRGYSDKLNFKPESLFALQASTDLGEGLSATTQIIARGANDYNVDMEWAYVTYQIDRNWKVNAGKLRVPFYRYSDFLDVGFSYNWVKPPQLVYSLPFNTYEGISVINNGRVADFDYIFQGFTGAYDGGEDSSVKVDGLSGVNLTLDYDEWLSLRGGYIVGDVSFDAGSSFGALTQLLDFYRLEQAKNDLVAQEDPGVFIGVGGKIDYNNWLAEVEYTELKVDNSLLAVQKRSYVSFGRRIDNLVLQVTYEKADDESNEVALSSIPTALASDTPTLSPQGPVTLPAGTPVVMLDATGQPTPQLLYNFIHDNVLNEPSVSELSDATVLSFGARYDISYNAAVKVEYSKFEQDNRNRDASALRFGIDLMF